MSRETGKAIKDARAEVTRSQDRILLSAEEAIAAGNAIVLKAPQQSPGVVAKLVELFVDAGTPPGFVNLLYGNTVGPALVDVRRAMRVVCEEVFGPVVTVQRYRELKPVFESISADRYGPRYAIRDMTEERLVLFNL